MRLRGYTSDDIGRISYTDDTLSEGSSELIAGLRLKKDGTFHAKSRTLSDQQINEMIDMTEEHIRKAGERILDGDFKIDPKQIDGENRSCAYCKFRALCYKTDGDLVYISTKEEEEDA